MIDGTLDPRLLEADRAGVRLEIIGGLPVWEFHPVWRHQETIDHIRASITGATFSHVTDGSHCIHISDVYVAFPDGSLKRPDIAIFCGELEEDDKAITLIPEAVIEIVSKGYELKDLQLAPYFYLAQGVKDVIVFDPYTLLVLHFRHEKIMRYTSPVEITMECGCQCVV